MQHNLFMTLLQEPKANILEPLYKTIHYKTILIYDSLKVDPKSVVSKQKCIDYIEKWPLMVIFLYNLDIFVWIQVLYPNQNV